MSDDKTKAYAWLLEELEIALECVQESSYHYLSGYNGHLYHAESNGTPTTIDASQFETLIQTSTVYVVGWLELYEFSDILPTEKVEL